MPDIQINKELPIGEYEDEIIQSFDKYSNLIIIGETGSGKTTQIPLMILKSLYRKYGQDFNLSTNGRVAVTQPRRIAATSVSEYVSKQIKTTLGEEVGYRIRFHDVTSQNTQIVFMTDGILLREAQIDPLLLNYNVVMVDEAHERNINSDFLIGLLVDVQKRRKERNMYPLQIIVSSATLERNKFIDYFAQFEEENHKFIEIPGRLYEVKQVYSQYDILNYEREAALKVAEICIQDYKNSNRSGKRKKRKYQPLVDHTGDILIFMPGKREIEKTKFEIQNLKGFNSYNLEIVTIHADLPIEEQNKIFTQTDKRKVVIATNIAETSITVPGIVYVIDSGLIKQMDFDPQSNINSLVTKYHAKKGLIQRMGRAGRVQKGYYYALFTRNSFDERDEFPTPEILRSSLSQIVLVMKKIGIEDVVHFNFIDRPSRKRIKHAIKELKGINAIDKAGEITQRGEEIVSLPLEPKLANLIIEAKKRNCVEEIITVSAFLEQKPLILNLAVEDFVKKITDSLTEPMSDSQIEKEAFKLYTLYKQKAGRLEDQSSDFFTYLKVWDKWERVGFNEKWAEDNYLSFEVLNEARNIKDELKDILVNLGILNEDEEREKLENPTHTDSVPSYYKKHMVIEETLIKSFGYNILVKIRRSGSYKNIKANQFGIRLHGSSVLFESKPKFILSYEVIEINEIDSQPKLSARVLHNLSKKNMLRFFSNELKHFERNQNKYTRRVRGKGNGKHKRRRRGR